MARPRPLADFVETCLGRAVAAQGFTNSDLLLAWPEIAGDRLGRVSQPVKVEWPRRRPGADRDGKPDPATLVLRVEGAFALDAQHMAPLLVERINAVYGWRCIGRIVLKQGPVRRPGPKTPPRRALSEAERGRVAGAVEPVDDPRLRDALARLGGAVLAAVPPVASPGEPGGGDSLTGPTG